MNSEITSIILTLAIAVIERSNQLAAVHIEEGNRYLDQAQKAFDLMDTASSDSARSALRFAGNERLSAASAKVNAFSENAVLSCHTRTAAIELTAILKTELVESHHSSPEVTGEISLDIAKLETITEEEDGHAAIQTVVDIIRAALKRAA